jgi:hypothetical protein
MATFEKVGRENWDEFINSPRAVLMLGKTDCAACNAFTEELEGWCDSCEGWDDVRFGKVLIDKPGLAKFKKQSPWLAQVTDLPYTVIYSDGEVQKTFMGGGIDRLTNRLERVFR